MFFSELCTQNSNTGFLATLRLQNVAVNLVVRAYSMWSPPKLKLLYFGTWRVFLSGEPLPVTCTFQKWKVSIARRLTWEEKNCLPPWRATSCFCKKRWNQFTKKLKTQVVLNSWGVGHLTRTLRLLLLHHPGTLFLSDAILQVLGKQWLTLDHYKSLLTWWLWKTFSS